MRRQQPALLVQASVDADRKGILCCLVLLDPCMSTKGTGALSVLRRSSGDMESSLGCVQESRQHVRGILEAVAGCAKYPDTSSAAALDPSDRSTQGSRAPRLTPV